MHRLGLIVLCSGLALATSCNGLSIPLIGTREAPAVPDWVAHPPSEAGMVYAVGQAPLGQREAALANAKRELVSQLQVTIQTDTRTNQNYAAEDASGQQRTERYQEGLTAEVRQRSGARDLPGVAPVRQEDAQGSTYVLVALDRAVWAKDLTARLAAADSALGTEYAGCSGAPQGTPGERLALAGRLLGRVLPLLVERTDLADRLRIATPGAQPPASPVSRTTLSSRITDLLTELPVALPGDPALADLLPALTDSLQRIGLTTLSGAEAKGAALRVELTLQVRTETIAGQVRADGVLKGALILADGRRLGGISLSDRASALGVDVAKERVVRKLAVKLAEDLDKRLLGMLATR